MTKVTEWLNRGGIVGRKKDEEWKKGEGEGGRGGEV